MKTNKKIWFGPLLVLCLGFGGAVVFGELPADFPGLTVTTFEPTAVGDGYVFLEVTDTSTNGGFYVMILNNDGTPFWYKSIPDHNYDFKVLPNGYLHYAEFYHTYSWTGGGDCMHKILDENYNLRESITAGNGYTADSHDFQLLPNGHVLLLSYYKTQMDLAKIIPGAYPNAMVAGTLVQELDTQRNVVFQWRTWDHYAFQTYYGPVLNMQPNFKNPVVDSFHLNTVILDSDQNLLISNYMMDVQKINRTTGEVMWRLGGLGNQFTFINVNPMIGIRHFSSCHSVTRLPNNNILVYSNADQQSTRSSTVNEYQVDEVNKTATLVWSYAPPTNYYAWHYGNAQRLSNGNTFIGWGGANIIPGVGGITNQWIPTCTEVTSDGRVVFEIKFDDPQIASYRAFRFNWPPDQKIESTKYELATGNEYVFDDTGVSLVVLEGGGGYNAAVVTREPYAPVYPQFFGKAPQVLPIRVKITPYNIESMTANLFFSVDSFGFKDPTNLTVYHREFPGQGLFIPLPTNYNPISRQLRTTMDRFGEFIFGYPDVADVPFAPILNEVESDRGIQTQEVVAAPLAVPGKLYAVNQTLPISLSWSPKGMARSYQLQIAEDADFTNIVVDESWMTEARYVFTTAKPDTTYFYRVHTTNEGGTSDWSIGSFVTVPPMIQVTVPNGGEVWKRGLSSFIQWTDNIGEKVVLDLYKADALVKTIATVASTGAYKWSIGLDLQPGCDYSIRVTSSTNAALFDQSDKPFHLDVAVVPGDFNCDGCVGPDDLAVMANDWLKEQAGLPADLDASGRVDLGDFAILAENWMDSCI